MIVGIDPSTKSTGLALADGTLATIAPRAGAKDPGRRLVEIEEGLVRLLRIHPPRPALAVIEAHARHSPGIDSTVAVAEVRGVMKRALHLEGIPFLEIQGSQLKRYATGSGAAPKEAMVDRANRELERGGRHVRNDDEADAYWLRHLGLAAYGYLDPREPYRLEIIAAISWPNLPGVRP